MKSIVYPSRLSGKIKAPSSKSYAQRAIIISAISEGCSTIHCSDIADDTWVALIAASGLGARVEFDMDKIIIHGLQNPMKNEFFAGESGLTGRILSSLFLCTSAPIRLDGAEALRKRPFDTIFPLAQQLSKKIQHSKQRLPFNYMGDYTATNLVANGSVSSQFISGLLIGLARINYPYELKVSNIKSRPYLDMTIAILKNFNVFWDENENSIFKLSTDSKLRACDYNIEADWSSAALLYACGSISGPIEITNLNPTSLQADRAILNLISHDFRDNTLVSSIEIKAFDFDATDCPDLFPPLAALAVYANGVSSIKGVHRLKHKESDRAISIQQEFGKLGVLVEIRNDKMIIHPSQVKSGTVYAHHDHRIAMALTAIALRANGPVEINGTECISKSYPYFYRDLINLGAKIESIP